MNGWAIRFNGKLVKGTLAVRRDDAWAVMPGLREPFQSFGEWKRAKRKLGYQAVRVVATEVRHDHQG